jgi:tetratricopeptide (TPR) repeat protein
MNPNDDHWNEEKLAALFAAANPDATPPDEEFLDRLRERSAQEFQAQSQKDSLPSKIPSPRRRRPMFVLAARGLVVSAMAVAAVVAMVWTSSQPDTGPLSLGALIENVAKADTVRLDIVRNDQIEKVWARRPHNLRIDSADGTHAISLGTKLWRIDEKANRATVSASPYYNGDRPGLSPLALLGINTPDDSGEAAKRLLQSQPVEQVQRDGVPLDRYEVECDSSSGPIQLIAFADSRTRSLRSIAAMRRIGDRLEPIAEIKVVALNEPVDEDLFVVGDTLTEDGRIGKVADVQGIVAVRPVMQKRWSPLVGHMLLKPGDWVRTDVRGANAVALRLMPRTNIVLGPGSLVELISPKTIKIISGELRVKATKKSPVELIGPGEKKIDISNTAVIRLQQEQLVRLDEEPPWLTGFEGTTTNESLGSLLAKVDGRDVPLTVGYHRVKVDIRDQIARTVIEESFVNHTKVRTEGVFYFPLPQDASISGFAMWIGGEKVTADIVEKQRAREIYEEILRERRDPGLLEWAGGNIFKARVFPIEPRQEKRIEISYTQVLPLRGNQFRYSYGLCSELLQQNPLGELGLDVTTFSAQPLAAVSSPTHTTRIDQTKNSAHLEFAAQEYTPTRDFEVVVELDKAAAEVVMIPHQRGKDGYFLLQLKPPAEDNAWQREIVSDAGPLDLLILADTSASMDNASRTTQADFIASLLGALTPEDKFNLAGCDVTCEWTFQRAMAAGAENIEKARRHLADRVSLGWTDLDQTFASALKQCGPKTRVVYVGDGIVTGKDSDPVAFGKRLRKLYEGHSATFHAISTSSSFEPVILKTIGSLGGGSMLAISGERGPQVVALELLGEITKPTIRDLKVEFRGLQTARVYPEELPNLAPGTQQILLGRYLPEGQDEAGEDQSGQVIVTGMLGDKPVRFMADVSLREAESGNSFIPRLWARKHLDVLLEQGAAGAMRDEIIGLSEEYHIMTPYTSLLVLESDADRERFKVKRRFQIRDGERFFAEGRAGANYELVQQQMRRAGNWRVGLRRSVLQQLLGLGRDASIFDQPSGQWGRIAGPGRFGGQVSRERSYSYWGYMNGRGGGIGGGGSGFIGGGMSGPTSHSTNLFFADGLDTISGNGSVSWYSPVDGSMGGPVDFELDAMGEELDWPKKEGAELFVDRLALNESMPVIEDQLRRQVDFDGDFPMDDKSMFTVDAFVPMKRSSRFRGTSKLSSLPPFDRRYFGLMPARSSRSRREIMSTERYDVGFAIGYENRTKYPSQPVTQWIDGLFPGLPAVPAEYEPPKDFKPWPADVRKLAESLLRTKQLTELEGGLIIERKSEHFDTRWDNLTSRPETLQLVSPKAWLVRSGGHRSQTLVAWCNTEERGVLSKGLQLGRLRTSEPRNLSQPPLTLAGNVMASLERTYWNYKVSLQETTSERSTGENRLLATLVLRHPTTKEYELHFTIDTVRDVLVKTENIQKGEVTSSSVLSDFVEIAGGWWATRIETFDKDGKRTSVITQNFRQVPTNEFQRRIDLVLTGRDKVQFLKMPLVTLDKAKRARDEGKAAFEDQVVLMLHFAASQQWDRVAEHLEVAEKLAGDKPGMFWLRNVFLRSARRHEELRGRILDRAAAMAGPRVAGQLPVDEYFLAEYLRGQTNGVLQANEMLELLETLRPIFERQDPLLAAIKHWNQQRINYLRNAGQQEEALALQGELAEQYPRDYNLQQQYAQSLVNARRFDGAGSWLDRVLVEESKWLTHEEESLRNVYTQMLRNRGDYRALVEYLAAWIENNPESGSAYQQYLSALVRADREDEANDTIQAWLAEGRTTDELSSATGQRLYAAARQAIGQGYNLYTNRIDDRWPKPLADLVLFTARLDKSPQAMQVQAVAQIMGHHRFRQTDECREVRRVVARLLVARIDTLPVDRVGRFYGWISPNDPVVENNVWQRVTDGLMKRWEAEEDADKKHRLAQPLIQILSGKLGTEPHLAFLRRQFAEGPKKYRTTYAGQLFNTLIGQPWLQSHEDEAFGLLEQLSDAEEPLQRLAAQIQALHRLTDAMVRARFTARMATVKNSEKLTRPELRQKQSENLRKAREGFADRLTRAMQQPREGKTSAELARWINAERLYLDVLAGRKLDRVIDECWELLGPKPLPIPEEVKPEFVLEEILRGRCLVTLANLAARKEADKGLIERLLAYCDAGTELQPQSLRWKMAKYQLLVALDRAEELEKHLRDWIHPDRPDRHWRQTLAYLLAEQGKIAEAIKHFEMIETADELGPAEYRALADWYMVVDRRKDYQRSKIAMYKTMEERRMSNWLSQQLRPWQQQRGQLPEELDAEVLIVFQALFAKSGSPQNYLYQLREFYRATRDLRLPGGLPDAVIGHTAGKVYPFLQGMGTELSEIREEATADSIVERIVEVRQEAKTTIDRRALDLLESLIERRAAELLNQPGPHGEKALAAMQRAFKREWSSGEPRLMADFLAGLGAITDAKLAEEQIRELTELHREATPGTIDRLHIAHQLAQTHWNYSRREVAIDLLAVALDEFQEAHDGVLPTAANNMLRSFVVFLNQSTHHARSEKVLLGHRQRNKDPQQEYWLVQLLYETYEDAIQNDGHVSLGTGKELFDALEDLVRGDLDTADHDHRHQLVDRLCGIYRSAHRKNIAGAVDSLKDFAANQVPEVLARQTNNYQSIVIRVAQTLHNLAGARQGLAFLVTRIEEEPSWFRLNNGNGWRRHGHQLGQWREESQTLGKDLEERLLKIVTDELRRDLRSRQQHNRHMYYSSYSHFWKEKAHAFARTAEEVLAEQKNSGAAVKYIADYLYHGLDRHNRAIEILFVAHDAELLDEGGQSTLADYLQARNRHGESIIVLQSLIKRSPSNIGYRCQLMHAYFRTERPEELLALLERTDKYFHEEGRWNEDAMSSLASSCLRNKLYKQSVAYYKELIPLHEKSQPNRGIGNGTLSSYYTSLANAYSGLKNTDEAVKAAGAAIVSWGPRHENRQHAIDTLRSVVREAHDFDAYVARLDKQAAKSKLHNPIVRLAIGQAYQGKQQFDKAIVQLELAVELQPNDKQTHKALVSCYDQQGDKEGAIDRLLASLQLSRRDLDLYEDLGNRLKALDRAKETERAYTSIVEMLPNESESHTKLAEILQKQGRWDDAVAHWHEVIRIRSLEPEGLIGLAKAQISQNLWAAASETVEKLSKTGWPSRFDSLVNGQVRDLRRQIEQKQTP